MKRLIVATACVLAAAAFAPSALATQSLTVTASGPTPADGFDVSVAGRWRIDSCTGSGTFTAVGTEPATVSYAYDLQKVHMDFGTVPDVSWGLTSFQANCTLSQFVVTHPLKWRWFTKRKSGTNASSRARSGPCFFDGFGGWLTLDCWGGNYAVASYRFSLPADARNIDRSIFGFRGCCWPGSVTRSWSGTTAQVKVTGWRKYTVTGVDITYQHRVRVRTMTTVYDNGTGTWNA